MAKWKKKLYTWRRWEVQNPVRKFLFCKNSALNALEINNSPRFTTFTAFTARYNKYAVRIIYLHRLSPHFFNENSPPNLNPGNEVLHFYPASTQVNMISIFPSPFCSSAFSIRLTRQLLYIACNQTRGRIVLFKIGTF